MIYSIRRAFKIGRNGLNLKQVFEFSQGNKIYEGMILSEKLKYTHKDNLDYLDLCQGITEQNPMQKRKEQKFVNRMLLSSIFSRIIGANLSMSIYLNQKVQIHKDLPINQEIQGRVQIAKNLGKDRYQLITEVLGKDKKGETVKYVSGQALIMLKA